MLWRSLCSSLPHPVLCFEALEFLLLPLLHCTMGMEEGFEFGGAGDSCCLPEPQTPMDNRAPVADPGRARPSSAGCGAPRTLQTWEACPTSRTCAGQRGAEGRWQAPEVPWTHTSTPTPHVQQCCRPLCYEQSERRLHKSLQMKMEEMSLSGLDNSKLEVRAPPRVPLALSRRLAITKPGIHSEEESGWSAWLLKGKSQLREPKDPEEERTPSQKGGNGQESFCGAGASQAVLWLPGSAQTSSPVTVAILPRGPGHRSGDLC